jgi:hypothetical protein
MPFLVFRAFRWLMCLGFLMVPGIVVLHLCGAVPAVFAVAIGAAVPAILVARRAWRENISISSVLTSECDMGWQLQPMPTFIAGVVFAVGGCWILNAPVGHGPNAMNRAEQSWFGTIFLLLGIGIMGAGISWWLAGPSTQPDGERQDWGAPD